MHFAGSRIDFVVEGGRVRLGGDPSDIAIETRLIGSGPSTTCGLREVGFTDCAWRRQCEIDQIGVDRLLDTLALAI